MIMPKPTKQVVFYTTETKFCAKLYIIENFEVIKKIQSGVKLLLKSLVVLNYMFT